MSRSAHQGSAGAPSCHPYNTILRKLLEGSSISAAILDGAARNMKVVLMCKLAEESLDGVDVRDRHVGDVLDLPSAQAHVLVAERWAIPDRRVDAGVVPVVERRRTDVTRSQHSDLKSVGRAS